MYPSSNQFEFQNCCQNQQTKIRKTLLIQCLQNNFSQQYQVSIPYDSITRQLDLGSVLHQIFFQILNSINQYQIFYFSSSSGYFHFGGIYPFNKKFILGQEFIPKDQIFIAFRKAVHVDQDSKSGGIVSQNNLEQPETKKKRRVNDRTILETLQKVSLWRSKCQEEKITFEEAAKETDIPKKTLDDYYALIRTGEQYGFDFQKNYSQKIGVLRQFVKEKQINLKEKKSMASSKPKKSKYLINSDQKNASSQEDQYKNSQKVQKSQRKVSIIDKMMLENDSNEDEEE